MGDEASKADFSSTQSQVGSTAEEVTGHAVVAGGNPRKIAKHLYGNANAWKRLLDANRADSPIRTGSGSTRS